MSASIWTSRSRRQTMTSKKAPKNPKRRGWIGVDFAHLGTSRPSRALLPLLILASLVALGVAALRIDLIRTRYALAAAMEEEKGLIADQHALIVAKRRLRDPVDLAVLARERGFRPAEATRSLTDPMPTTDVVSPNIRPIARPALPAVAADPPSSAHTSSTADPRRDNQP